MCVCVCVFAEASVDDTAAAAPPEDKYEQFEHKGVWWAVHKDEKTGTTVREGS